MIERADLFERLARPASGVCVVTPNRRLALSLGGAFDALQRARGLQAWEACDILPFSAFVSRLYEDSFYLSGSAEIPVLLSASQEEQLWRAALEGADLLAPGDTAARCRDAWALAHAWRIPPMAGNEDASAFLAWSRDYAKRCGADVDSARLPDVVLGLQGLALPKILVAYAFDILPPQTREFLDALAGRGVEVLHGKPEARAGSVGRSSFASAPEELESAAHWARTRLEAGAGRIGVVVPDLHARRREVVRVFSRIMQPGFGLPGTPVAPLPFNVSLGTPLAETPLVRAALGLIELSQGEVAFEAASRLVRSPFVGAAERELAARARLEVRLRRKLGARVSLPKLIASSERAPLLRGLLEKLFGFREEGLFAAKTPAEWARHFSTLLAAAGFPGERSLDSVEYQTQAKWHEALAEFARLDRVCGEVPFRAAFGVLRRLCADTLFQPESGEAPVQVLGVLESAGAEFDCLWVSGLTDEAWPLAASPNPFLPLAAQRKAGIPESSVEGALELDRRITQGWKGAAGEVVLSSFRKDEDRDVSPSPLILDVPAREVAFKKHPSLREAIFKRKAIKAIEDRVAPPVRVKQVFGGTKVLSDQAACPFRAFAKHRLAADTLEEPPEGLDAAQRGTLLHELMKHLWTRLKDSSALSSSLDAHVEEAASAAVKELELEGRFADLERERLIRLAHDWLEIERARPPFEVTKIEEKATIAFGGLEFTARLDRVDRLSTGGHAIIDYKTSRPSTTKWGTPRPDEPQLPLYAVSAKEEITALAFARLRPGEMRFIGHSRDQNALPDVRPPRKAWRLVMQEWKDEAESLGKGFAEGLAGVDPKRDLMTCRYCGLETLCRVYEKVNIYAEEEFEE